MDRKMRVGRVVSAKMDKTVVVAVDTKRNHRLYKKAVTKTTRFKVHDENGSSGIGDLVRIQETRPLSKEKRWRLIEIIDKGAVDEILSDEGGIR
ncbi:MAG: 30S ribosomal protein S17 [Chloroflexota bacterium]|jgi:small subunit ribosomal protein S17|nr:30S ribosomal protein S17 [Chloroflexota bacterium]|tara:strand:- start:725 stop:1006 length:282 start_codon:yes stop_codon:yes gene_type:complete